MRWDTGCWGPGIFMMKRSKLKGKKNQTNIHLQLVGIVYVTNEYNNNISIKIFLDYIYISAGGQGYSIGIFMAKVPVITLSKSFSNKYRCPGPLLLMVFYF